MTMFDNPRRKRLYHVTLAERVPAIQAYGLLMGQPSNWIQESTQQRYGQGEIYASESKNDAMRWASKMDWGMYQTLGSGNIVIVSFRDDEPWEVDEADPLSQMGNEKRWLKKVGKVAPEKIDKIEPFTTAMARKLARNPPPERPGLVGPVFHGTCHVFGEFDIEKSGDMNLYGPGFYFTTDPQIASEYASGGERENFHWKSYEHKQAGWAALLERAREKLPEDEFAFAQKEAARDLASPDPKEYFVPLDLFQVLTKVDMTVYVANACASNVWVAFLDIQNPLNIWDDVWFTNADMIMIRDDLAADEYAHFMSWHNAFDRALSTAMIARGRHDRRISGVHLYDIILDAAGHDKEEALKLIQAAGFDAIHHEGGLVFDRDPHNVYVVWDPAQVIPAYQSQGAEA
jgi:hypothetical protein